MAKILIVDDDGHIREVMRFALEQAGHTIVEAGDGSQALAKFDEETPDVVVLDIVMPEEDGLSVCRKLREKHQTPILFVSSRDDELDRVLGLEMGADDYITKPFSPRELVARIKAVLRRLQPGAGEVEGEAEILNHGDLKVDCNRHRCYWGDTEIILTVTEFALLRTLLASPGRVYNRSELVDKAYGGEHFITDRTVDSHIRRIRKKFGNVDADPIETVYGLGYRLRT